MDGQAVLENCQFEIYIPPLEGIANANESRTIGFQGETLGIYVLVYKNRGKKIDGDLNIDSDKDSISSAIDSYLSSLKFQTQLLLQSTGEDVVSKPQYYHQYQQNFSTSSTSPTNKNSNGNNTQKIPSKSSEYESIAKARKSVTINQDIESILLDIRQQQDSPTRFRHGTDDDDHYNNDNNININDEGYSYSPQRRRRLSFVSEKDAAPFLNPDYIYKILAPINIGKENIGVPLKLVVKVIVDPFSWTIQHDTIFDSTTLECNRQLQRSGNSNNNVNHQKSHREYLSKLVDNSIHCVSDPFCRILSMPFQVLNPLQITVKSTIIDVVSYINIKTKNTHSNLTLCINEIQFPLNSTVKLVEDGQGKIVYRKNQRLDARLHIRIHEYDGQIILNPNEEYSFVIQIEPSYIFTVSDAPGGYATNDRNIIDVLHTATEPTFDPMFISSGKFQTPATILWGVIQVAEPSHGTTVSPIKPPSPTANVERHGHDEQSLVPKVALESTITVPWSRGSDISANNRTASNQYREKNAQKLVMEIEYDPIVRVNNIFTVRVAITNTSQDALSNLNLIVPIGSEYYVWENEVQHTSPSLFSSLPFGNADDDSINNNAIACNNSTLGNKMNKLRNSIIDRGGSISLSDVEDFNNTIIAERNRLGSSPGNHTFEEIDLASSINSDLYRQSKIGIPRADSINQGNGLTSEQVLNKTKSLKTTSKQNLELFSSGMNKPISDANLNGLPTPNGRTLFHAIFQYSTLNTSTNKSSMSISQKKHIEKTHPNAGNANFVNKSSSWVNGIPLSSQCVLQINADGFKIFANNNETSNHNDAKRNKIKTKSWQFTSTVRIHAEKISNEKLRIDIIDDIVKNSNETMCIINSLFFIVRNASIIVNQFEALYSMLIAMLQQKGKSAGGERLRKDNEDSKNKKNSNVKNELHPTVICLQATVPLGILSPADTVFSTLHFIALKTGTLKFSGIQIGNTAEDVIYRMDRPYAVTVLPQHSITKIAQDTSILSLLPPLSVQEL
jgi:hypothetical protein